jgi:hypothetical protein
VDPPQAGKRSTPSLESVADYQARRAKALLGEVPWVSALKKSLKSGKIKGLKANKYKNHGKKCF